MAKSDQFSAYFESEAARLVVSPNDHAFAAAVNRIADDDGASFRAWLAGADDMVKAAIRAAYERENSKNLTAHRERMAKALEAFRACRAEGGSKTKSLKAAKAVYSRFELRDAR